MTDHLFDQPAPSRAAQLMELGALSMTSERNGSVHTVCLFGELDIANADRVEAELKRMRPATPGESCWISPA